MQAITKVKGAIFDVIDVTLTYISIHGFRSGALIKQITGNTNIDLPQWYNKMHRCLVKPSNVQRGGGGQMDPP